MNSRILLLLPLLFILLNNDSFLDAQSFGIYTLHRQELQSLVHDSLDQGVDVMEWGGNGPIGTAASGVVIFRLQISESDNKSYFKKLVIAP